jgi:hypothetical protein
MDMINLSLISQASIKLLSLCFFSCNSFTLAINEQNSYSVHDYFAFFFCSIFELVNESLLRFITTSKRQGQCYSRHGNLRADVKLLYW